MKIVADQDIFQVEAAFSPYGELILLPGREINHHHVADADVLLVRTVTRVDQALIADTTLQFIGSAASGTDHIDFNALNEREIVFSHAPGCNASAVVNYVLAVLAWAGSQGHEDWRQWSVGIVGAGNVGGKLAVLLDALGMQIAIYDPLLENRHPLSPYFSTLESVLSRDVVTLHTPLTRAGKHPTWHMLNHDRLAALNDDCVLINAARGAVVDNQALGDMLAAGKGLRVALDVWENEPEPDPVLLAKVMLGTPHIAGYSLNGKRNATTAVLQDFCRHFCISSEKFRADRLLEALTEPPASTSASEVEVLNHYLLQAYPIQQDFLGATLVNVKDEFERRRNGYDFRREFGDCSIEKKALAQSLADSLQTLGFNLV